LFARQATEQLLKKGMGHEGLEGTGLNISNEELAKEASVTIFTLNRLLSEWQRKGFLWRAEEGSWCARLKTYSVAYDERACHVLLAFVKHLGIHLRFQNTFISMGT
jgi:DNA-binding IclR family transcriptional regulator